jgi:hypothetical protein
MSTLSVPRIIDVVDVFQRNCTLDTAKNGVLVYFFAKRALKLWRHVRARGLRRSFTDLYVFFAQVSTPLFFFSLLVLHLRPLFFVLENSSAHH